jgi:hypothetical protein
MTSIIHPITALKATLASSIVEANSNGNDSVASQEIAHSTLPKRIKKTLHQIGHRAGNSEGGRSVDNMIKISRKACDKFEQLAGSDLYMSKAELADIDDVWERALMGSLQRVLHESVRIPRAVNDAVATPATA